MGATEVAGNVDAYLALAGFVLHRAAGYRQVGVNGRQVGADVYSFAGVGLVAVGLYVWVLAGKGLDGWVWVVVVAVVAYELVNDNDFIYMPGYAGYGVWQVFFAVEDVVNGCEFHLIVSGNTPKPSEQQCRNIVFPFLFQLICDLI